VDRLGFLRDAERHYQFIAVSSQLGHVVHLRRLLCTGSLKT
jgi:hypothetical protein